MDNVHPLAGAMQLGGGMPSQSTQEQMITEQRRAAAVQLAIQSLHGDEGSYDNDKLIDRAEAISRFIADGKSG